MMQKKKLIITAIVLLVTTLIPINQVIFAFILGALLVSSLVFLLRTMCRKKISYHAPSFFKILLLIIIALELHFTKNLIIGRDYQIFGELIGQLNYIISFVILGLFFIFIIFFTINFIYKETIKFDPLTDMDTELFRIDGKVYLDEDQRDKDRETVKKTSDYFSRLQNAHKDILTISVITAFLHSFISLLLISLSME